jgi:NIPSNAP
MILVRDVFRLKFGKAREAQAAFKDVGDAGNRAGFRSDSFRVLVDLVGPYYTLVLETTYGNLAEYEQMSSSALANQEWRSAYQKFTPHVESGYREIFTIVQ